MLIVILILILILILSNNSCFRHNKVKAGHKSMSNFRQPKSLSRRLRDESRNREMREKKAVEPTWSRASESQVRPELVKV